jgi:hypothetical protein
LLVVANVLLGEIRRIEETVPGIGNAPDLTPKDEETDCCGDS